MSERKTSTTEAHETAKVLMKFANNMSADYETFALAVLQEHRTLQQNVFEAFLHLCQAWAKLDENRYDLRNEYTVETSKKIMEMLGGCARTPFI